MMGEERILCAVHKKPLITLQYECEECLEANLKEGNKEYHGYCDEQIKSLQDRIELYEKALSTPAEENKELAMEFMNKVHEGWDKADLGGVMTVMELTREYLNHKAQGE